MRARTENREAFTRVKPNPRFDCGRRSSVSLPVRGVNASNFSVPAELSGDFYSLPTKTRTGGIRY